jgi:transcription antitermination factor NusG
VVSEPPADDALVLSSPGGWGGARKHAGGARRGAGRPRKAVPAVVGVEDVRVVGRPRKVVPVVVAGIEDIMHWYCVRTGFSAELTADFAIRLADRGDDIIGFPLFSPMLWKPATLWRRNANGSVRMPKPERLAPLFPRYLFVRFTLADPDWRLISRLSGVDCIMSSAAIAGGYKMPVPVPDASIERIRSLPGMAANGCLYPSDYHASGYSPLRVGSPLRVISGSLRDREGICTWSDRERVKFLFSLFGRDVEATAARADVEAA